MRIGFTGTGGTGKTTVLRLISDRLEQAHGIGALPSVTRSVFERFGLTESDQESMDPFQRLELQLAIMDARRKAESEAGGFVSDRTLADSVAYMLVRCYQSMDAEMLESVLDELSQNLASYDLIVYFPIEFVPEPDGVRQDGEAYRYLHDSVLKRLLADYAPKASLISVVDLVGVPKADAGIRSECIFNFIGTLA